MNLGDFDPSAVIYHKFTTFRPSTGAPYTLAGTPAVSVYKDNSATQSTSGVTLTADFDSVTGLNHIAIDTSSDGAFYSTGSFFDIVITTGTVDSVSAVGTVVGRFTLRKSSALRPSYNLPQRDVSALSTSTVEDALSSARGQGAGAWSIVGLILTLHNPDGSTFRTFNLDSSPTPSSRT